MGKAHRKAMARLARRVKNETVVHGVTGTFHGKFGQTLDANGQSAMYHKPGSQNRNK